MRAADFPGQLIEREALPDDLANGEVEPIRVRERLAASSFRLLYGTSVRPDSGKGGMARQQVCAVQSAFEK